MKLWGYIDRVGLRDFFEKYADELVRAPKTHHSYDGGIGVHTLQVVEKALELNVCGVDEQSLIRVCLLHDIFHHDYDKLFREVELTEQEQTAIRMAHGCWSLDTLPMDKLAYLLFIADTWSAKVKGK